MNLTFGFNGDIHFETQSHGFVEVASLSDLGVVGSAQVRLEIAKEIK